MVLKYNASLYKELSIAILAIVNVVVTIELMYHPQSKVVFWFTSVLNIIAFIDFSYCLATASILHYYVFSWIGLLDFLSALPIISFFFLIEEHYPSLLLLQMFAFFRLAKIIKCAQVIMRTNVEFQITRLIISISVYFLVAATLVYVLSEHHPRSFYDSSNESFSWFFALYYSFVVASTVGFGDITPVTTPSRLVTLGIIVTGFGMIPILVSDLLAAIADRPNKYRGDLNLGPSSKIRHICLCGIVNLRVLEEVIAEVFHDVSHCDASKLCIYHLVILAPCPPSFAVKQSVRSHRLESDVSFFIGSAKIHTDLDRIKASTAKAIFLLVDFENGLSNEEESAFLSAISVGQYLDAHCVRRSSLALAVNDLSGDMRACRPTTVAVMPKSAQFRSTLFNYGIDVVCSIQDLRYALIGFGIIFPGFLSFFTVTSPRIEKPIDTNDSFYRIRIQQISRKHVSWVLQMSSFLTAVHLIYHASKGNVILLGVQPKHGSIMINPSGSCCYADESREPFILKNAEILFVITHYSLESTNDFLHSHRFSSSDGGRERAYSCTSIATVGRGDDTDSSPSYPPTPPLSVPQPSCPTPTRSISCLLSPQHLYEPQSSSKPTIDVHQPPFHQLFFLTKFSHIQTLVKSPNSANSAAHSNNHTPGRKYHHPHSHKPSHNVRRGYNFLTETNGASRLPLLCDHIVLILSYSATIEMPVNDLMVPIVHIVSAIGRETDNSQTIVVLAPHADEMYAMAADINTNVSMKLLQNVLFVVGSGRNLDHLTMCQVNTAKAVAISCPSARSVVHLQQNAHCDGKTEFVESDNAAIIAVLNTLNLLAGAKTQINLFAPQSMSTTTNAQANHRSMNPDNSTAATVVPKSHVVMEMMNSESMSIFIPYMDNYCNADDTNHPFCASGNVFLHSYLDVLMAQTLFNVGLIAFWEAVVGIESSSQGACNSPGSSCVADRGPYIITPEKVPASTSNSSTYSNHTSHKSCCFDRIKPPNNCFGLKYGEMFNKLLVEHHIIVVAIIRLRGISCGLWSSFPYVLVAPNRDLMVGNADECLIFRPTMSHNNLPTNGETTDV